MLGNNPFFQKLRLVKRQLPYFIRTLQIIWRAGPILLVCWFLLLLLQGILPAVSISLTRLLVNHLTVLLEQAPALPKISWGIAAPIVFLAGGIGLIMVLGQLIQSLSNWVHTAQTQAIGLHVSGLIQGKSVQADYSIFESSDKNDKLYQARVEGENRPIAILDNMGMLAQAGVTALSMLALLLPYGPWLILVLLASSLPVLWVVVDYKTKTHTWLKSILSHERRAWYYDWLLTSEESAAELRLYGTGNVFRQAYQEIRERIKKDRLYLDRQQMVGELAASIISLLSAGICMTVMMLKAFQGTATLGDLVLFYQVITQGQAILRILLQNVGQLYGNLLFLSNLYDFLDIENAVVDNAQPVLITTLKEPITICCENLTFAYPDSSSNVFSRFNLTLSAGKIVAIVGDNGAGKSTLVKLICRLYDPQEGRITFNGMDIRDFAQQDLRKMVTVLFQEPMQYQASVMDNIGYSAMNAASPRSGNQAMIDEIGQAAKGSGADEFIWKLPQKYETQLGKWFEDGTDLSVGQWQRIALARAFLRLSPIVLLDEPTSAMDAWSEADWLARLRKLIAGRTTLLITHRLTTAMQADVIHVMAGGHILESGSHAHLLKLNGRYAEAWRAQTDSLK